MAKQKKIKFLKRFGNLFSRIRAERCREKNQRGAIISDGKCVGINVCMGRKADGIKLRGVEKVVLPTVTVYENGEIEPMGLKLIFRSNEYAKPVIKAMQKPCTIEIRTAVQCWNEVGAWEVRGHSYILEATPWRIEPEPLLDGSDTTTTILFQVGRYSMSDTEEKELWSFDREGAQKAQSLGAGSVLEVRRSGT